MKYTDLTKLLSDNLAPKLDSVSEGYLFNQIKQKPGEGLSLFMSRIKEKAHHCEFGTFYDRMVRDRFLYGLRDTNIRSYLLTKSGLDTAAKVLKEAIAKVNALSANSAMLASGASTNLVKKNSGKSHARTNSKQVQKKGGSSLVCS